MSLPTSSAAAIDRLRRLYRQSLYWMIGYFGVILTGLLVPFAFLYLDPREAAQGVCLLLGVLLPCVGLVLGLLMLGRRYEHSRSLAVAEQGDFTGLTFGQTATVEDYEWLTPLPLWRGAMNYGGRNLLSGEVEGVAVTILDFSYSVRFLDRVDVFTQTVFGLPAAVEGVPEFTVTPRSLLDVEVLTSVLGSRQIKLPDFPAFNKKFVLQGDDREAVVACFTQEVVEVCLADGRQVVQCTDGVLAVHRLKKLTAPAEYPERIAAAIQLVDALNATVES